MTSCATLPVEIEDIKGKYSPSFKNAFTELELTDNYRFKYRHVIGLIDTKSEGSWVKKGNEIILNSDSKFETNKIDVVEKETDSTPKMLIEFQDGYPVELANILLNNISSKVYVSNEKGIVKFPKDVRISNFTIYYLGESYEYQVKKENSFQVKLFTNDLGRTYFKNRVLKLHRNELIDAEYNWKYRKVKE